MSDYFNLNEGIQKAKRRFPKFNTHFNKKLLFVLAVTLALPITLALVQQKQDIRKFASENNVRAKTVGYIVEYKSNPIARSLTHTNSAQLNSERIRVEADQQAAKKDILRILSKKDFTLGAKVADKAKVLGNFKYAINGIALDISAQEAEKLKASPYVKAVYPDLEVKSLLMDSVPLINADKAWLQKDQSGSQITGKGINIAIIDTGIDYLHEDLGKSNLVERTFKQVNTNPDVSSFKRFSLDNGRVAFSVGSQIFLLNIDSGEKKTITVGSSLDSPSRIILKNNYISYVNASNLYYYDLNNDKKGSIGSLDYYENYTLGDGKIVFSSRAVDVIYNISTATKKTISRASGDNPASFSVFGNNIAYFTNTTTEFVDGAYVACSGKLIIQDLDSLAKTEILIPSLGNLIDFDGNRILFTTCQKASDTGYKVYNLSTGQITPLSTSSPNPMFPYNQKPQGKLTGNLVYFTNPNLIANVFDSVKNRTVRINVLKKAIDFHAEGDKGCLMAEDAYIYCHTYDPNYDYPYPSTIFNQKVVGGYDFINNDDDPLDDNGHGSHVAATVGGNGVLKGVAPDANLIAYKVLDSNGGAGSFSTVISAIDAAIVTRLDTDPNNDISVMNLSLGAKCGGGYDAYCGPDDVISRAIDNASANGIVSVIAAGNSGSIPGTIETPGVARTAITVGSVNKSKQMSSFSSRGPVTNGGELLIKPDIVAPGEQVCAALGNPKILTFGFQICIDDKHVSLNGTSMASPHVAGVVALVKQAHPDWTPEQIKSAIKDTTENLGFDVNSQGSGFVDSLKALMIPTPTETPTPTFTPTPTPLPTDTPTPTPIFSPTPTLTPTPTPIPTFTFNLTPSADTFVKSSAPTTNFGTQTTLETDTGPKEISYFKFNLASLAGKKIVKATLILKVKGASSFTQTLRRGVNVNWSETGITYSNRPSFEAVISTFNAAPLNSLIQLGLTNAVNLRKGGNLSVGITSAGNDKAVFYSKESTSTNRPQLIIQYQ